MLNWGKSPVTTDSTFTLQWRPKLSSEKNSMEIKPLWKPPLNPLIITDIGSELLTYFVTLSRSVTRNVKSKDVDMRTINNPQHTRALETIEFFLNEFHWIQWIMTKSKSGIVTKVIIHLLTDTLPALVIKSAFSLLTLGRNLLPVTIQNRYQSTGSEIIGKIMDWRCNVVEKGHRKTQLCI